MVERYSCNIDTSTKSACEKQKQIQKDVTERTHETQFVIILILIGMILDSGNMWKKQYVKIGLFGMMIGSNKKSKKYNYQRAATLKWAYFKAALEQSVCIKNNI